MTPTFVNPLARGSSGIVGKAREIKEWVREALSLDLGVVVSVSELSCALPDCPPKETVILIMSRDTTRQISVHKAMADIDKDQILAACAQVENVRFKLPEA